LKIKNLEVEHFDWNTNNIMIISLYCSQPKYFSKRNIEIGFHWIESNFPKAFDAKVSHASL
jgi:hypothetical protein